MRTMPNPESAAVIRAACTYVVRTSPEYAGVPLYVPYLWMEYVESHRYEEDLSNTATFAILNADRFVFPELAGVDEVTLFQDDQGRIRLA